MSEAITGVLKFSFGLISNKLRSYGAEKLKDGGLTDQKLRGIIVREFDEIKSKLDAISRKDLLTSVSSLQEGIISLIMSYGESLESGNSSISRLPSAGACSIEAKPSLPSVTVEDAITLANAIGKMKIESKDRLESAKESFKEAGKKASEAFHNTGLSIEQRILAGKVRIASRILQHLDDLEFAVSKSLHCLRELNDMQAIQEIFSVDVKGGMKSVFKKDSRREIVETVVMVNWVLADFISTFTKQKMAVLDWPMIKCGKQFVHPIHYDGRSLPNLKEMEITPPWNIKVTEENMSQSISKETCVINKKGDLIYFSKDKLDLQKLDHATGKLQPYCVSSLDDKTECPRLDRVIGLAVDEDDTLYVISGDGSDVMLSVYSANGKNTHHCTLEFLKGFPNITINVNNDKNIIIGLKEVGRTIMVYLCNSNGALINSFDTGLNNDYFIKLVSSSSNKEVVLLTEKLPDNLKNSNALHMYREDGHLQKTVRLRPREGNDTYHNLFYNQVSNQIIGYVRPCYYGNILIEQLSGQTGELQHSYLMHRTNFQPGLYFHFFCHPSGTIGLLNKFHLILLKKPSQ